MKLYAELIQKNAALQRIHQVLVDRRLIGQAAAYAKFLIQERVAKGILPNGRPFKNYSLGYKKKREEAKKPVDKVYLEWTGQMMGDMTWNLIQDYAELYFATVRSEEIAGYLSKKGAGRKRKKFPFWCLNAPERAKIRKFYNEKLKVQLKAL